MSAKFLNNLTLWVGFASSLTKLWLKHWLVGLWQCACNCSDLKIKFNV
jgi:hypothetical protein